LPGEGLAHRGLATAHQAQENDRTGHEKRSTEANCARLDAPIVSAAPPKGVV
jgi:hypothetical protein